MPKREPKIIIESAAYLANRDAYTPPKPPRKIKTVPHVVEDGWCYIPAKTFELAASRAVARLGLTAKGGWNLKAGLPRRTFVLRAELTDLKDKVQLVRKTWPKGIKSAAADSYLRLAVADMNADPKAIYSFEVVHDSGGGSVNKETGWRELSFVTHKPWLHIRNSDPKFDDYDVNLLLEFKYNSQRRLVGTVMVIGESNIGITMRYPDAA